jgi:hypothetical protein
MEALAEAPHVGMHCHGVRVRAGIAPMALVILVCLDCSHPRPPHSTDHVSVNAAHTRVLAWQTRTRGGTSSVWDPARRTGKSS